MNYKELYQAKLKDPRWNLKRLEVLEACDFTCTRCRRSGVPLEVHHIAYKPRTEPWEYPTSNFEALCPRCHSDHHDAFRPEAPMPADQVLAAARNIVSTIAAKFTPPKAKVRFDFDADRFHRWNKRHVSSGPPQRAMMKFAHWLWNTGTRNMDMIERLAEEGLRVNPDSWYAYFAPGGPARECRTDQVAMEHAERESESFKEADAKFLGKSRAHPIDHA